VAFVSQSRKRVGSSSDEATAILLTPFTVCNTIRGKRREIEAIHLTVRESLTFCA
jgi:hypothetical protein